MPVTRLRETQEIKELQASVEQLQTFAEVTQQNMLELAPVLCVIATRVDQNTARLRRHYFVLFAQTAALVAYLITRLL